MKKHFLFLVLLLSISKSFADSSCWPEEKLVGKAAVGFIEGVNYSLFSKTEQGGDSTAAAKKCEVTIYSQADEKNPQRVECESIVCMKGSCGDGGDYTFLPVMDLKKPFVQVERVDGARAWLKIEPDLEVRPVLFEEKPGNLYPESVLVLDAPNGKSLKKISDQKVGYIYRKIIKHSAEEWVEVDVVPVLSEEPPIQVGKSITKGYFLYKNKEHKVLAVLSDIWCD